jgi:hypothetical protein
VHDRGNDSVFIYADPNNIDQLPITPDLMKGLTPYTLFLITLGCNVGGLKRVDREHRSKWFFIAAMIRQSLSPFHDLGLIALNNDSSQWAYLVVIPQKWSGSYLQSVEKIGNKMWTGGVSTLSMMRDGDASLIKKFTSLFLTNEEQKSIKSL